MSVSTIITYAVVTDYTNATEATLAGTLTGQPYGFSLIYNTDLAKTRIWDGAAFIDAPLPASTQPDLLITKNTPTLDQVITDGYSAYYSEFYEIADTKTLEIGINSKLEIG